LIVAGFFFEEFLRFKHRILIDLLAPLFVILLYFVYGESAEFYLVEWATFEVLVFFAVLFFSIFDLFLTDVVL